jgi:hypothetical protein
LLSLAELTSNNTARETTGFSPLFANYSFNPRLGFEP